MITREEAKEKLLGECKIIMHYTWSEDRQKVDVPHWYLSDSKTLKLLNEVYDSFEQHIKSLEAQLSNAKQLTCDGCEYDKYPNKFNVLNTCKSCCRSNLTDYYTTKDTQ